MDTAALTESPAAMPTPPGTMWPIVAALGGVLVVVGLVTYPPVFIFGIIALLGAAIEWISRHERAASADVNTTPTSVAGWPIPGVPAAGRGRRGRSSTRSAGSCCGFEDERAGAFTTIAVLSCWAGSFVAFRPSIRAGDRCRDARSPPRSHRRRGQRRWPGSAIEPHETTKVLAEDGKCTGWPRPRPTRARRSREGAKASIFAEITLTATARSRRKPPAWQRDVAHDHLPTRPMLFRTTATVRWCTDPARSQGRRGHRGHGPQRDGPQPGLHSSDDGGSQMLTFFDPGGERQHGGAVPVHRAGVDGAKIPVTSREQSARRTTARGRDGSHDWPLIVPRRLPPAPASPHCRPGVLSAGAPKDAHGHVQPAYERPADQNLQYPVFVIAGVVGLIVFAAVGWCIPLQGSRQPIPKQTGTPGARDLLTIIPAGSCCSSPSSPSAACSRWPDERRSATSASPASEWWWEATTRSRRLRRMTPRRLSGQMVIPSRTNVLVRAPAAT